MKKDKIVDIPLSRLLKRFSNTDVIVNMEKEYRTSKPHFISPKLIDDNKYVKKAKLNVDEICEALITIKDKGLNSPLIVRQKKDYFEIIIGRKRLIAAKKFKIETVPCVVIDVSDEEMLVMLAADIRDSNYSNMVELSMVCNRLTKTYHYSQKDLARLLHQSRSQMTNIIRLMNLPDSVLEDISMGKLSFGHAKALITLPDEFILEMVNKIYENKLSVRETEKLIQEYKNGPENKKVEEKLSKTFSCQTNILKKSVKFTFETEEEKTKFINRLISKK